MALSDSQKADIVNLYVGYFGRAPDPEGLNYWYGRYESGEMSLLQIANSFAVQPEALTEYTFLAHPNLQIGVTDFITSVYQNLFNRAVDDEGLAHWSAELLAGKPVGRFIVDVISGARGDDVTTLSNLREVALTYATTMANLSATWTVDDDRADAIAVLNGVTSDPNTVVSGGMLAVSLATADANVGTTYTLSSGPDTIVGTPKHDTISGTVSGSFAAFDSIDGGLGADSLIVTDTAAITATKQITVKSVESVSLTSASTVNVDASSWTGLQTLKVTGDGGGNTITAGSLVDITDVSTKAGSSNTTVQGGGDVTVTVTGATTGTITVGTVVAPSGTVTISNSTTDAGTMGEIQVKGGTAVNVTQVAGNAVNTTTTIGQVEVEGTSITKSVQVTNTPRATASANVAGVNANSVAITDVNSGSSTAVGTITTIGISGFTTAFISNTGLTDLSIANGSGNIIIDNSGLTTPVNTKLNLTINGQTGGTLDDADIYTAMAITTTGQNSTLANNTFGALKDLTIAGTKTLTLTNASGLTALKTVAVSGSAGIKADLSGATISSIDTSGTTGASTVTIDATKALFTGGAGADTVTTTASVTKAISLGAGDDKLTLGNSSTPTASISGGEGTDTLRLSSAMAATASGSNTFAGIVTGFERLELTGSTNQTIDLAVLGNFNYVTTSGGNGLTLSNMGTGGTLVLNGAGTAYTIGNSAFSGGADDTINLVLTDGSGANVSFASTGITASGVENFNITTADTQASPSGVSEFITLLGNSSKSITASGNAGLTLTATSTKLTNVDASGITLGGFSWTSGALAAAAVVKGSATGSNTVDLSAATGGAITYTGGSGNDSITINNGKANVIALGDGTNSLTTSGGANKITGGTGADTVTVGNGNNTVNLGNGTNAFTAGTGNNTYTGGTGVDSITVGGGANVLTLGGGADQVTITAASANVNTFTTVIGASAGVAMTFINQGTETFNSTKVVLGDTATFRDHADAIVQAAGNASVNAGFGWFQFAGNTYLVESLHDGSGVNASFVNGRDLIVRFDGLVDLSTASFNNTNTFVLA